MGHTAALEFRGTERFAVEKRLGSGGMGVVYLAHDRDRDTRVALKLLRKVDAMGLYRFKQEFRVLADVTHPNLVTLYELVSAGDQWFFTMEVLDGLDLLRHVRHGGGGARPGNDEESQSLHDDSTNVAATGDTASVAHSVSTATAATSDSASLQDRPDNRRSGGPPTVPPLCSPEQFHRLRNTLHQLTEGTMALHQAGHLHRDIKPTNVMVTREGRVVLLDFGIVTELAVQSPDTAERAIVGTPAYMAPEQAGGKPLTEASDWYAVGVMLYEALTGRRPFSGTTRALLEAKQKVDPPAPPRVAEGVTADLAELCTGLLARNPAERLCGRDILRTVAGETATPRALPRIRPAPGSSGALLVGREQHLDVLASAFAATRSGEPCTVFVSGRSGSGKSSLCNAFLGRLRNGGDAVVLAGRCYEQESVPYKALDSLIDALTRHLLELPAAEVKAIMPRTAQALARLFPVLRRVDAVLGAPANVLDTPDPHELRQRGFTALRRLLDRIADRGPLVLYLDDVQWADTDSAALLAEILRPPDPPPMLLIASYRSEDAETNAFLAAVRKTMPAAEQGDSRPGRAIELSVDSLAFEDARELATALLEQAAGEHSVLLGNHAEAIARESSGSPLFIHELVRHVYTALGANDQLSIDLEISLDDALRARIGELPDAARALLETIAVAGQPLSQGIVLEAADIGGEERTAFAVLRAGHLVRTRGSRKSDQTETYHDRIREVTVRWLTEERKRDCHRRLARALQSSPEGDPETLAVHLEAAGDNDSAAECCEAAAASATKALAFDRAATLYQRALVLGPQRGRSAPSAAGSRLVELQMRLGEALVNAGRGPEAADAFLAAAQSAPPMTRLECELMAAEQLLFAGHIERGLEAISGLLSKIGTSIPATPRRALASYLWQRLKLRVRGMGWKERPENEIPTSELVRVDVFKAVAFGLAIVDTVPGADFHTRSLLAALRAGERIRVLRALVLEAGLSAAQGRGHLASARRLTEQTREMMSQSDEPIGLALADLAEGITAYFEGRFPHAAERIRASELRFRDETTGTAMELSQTRTFRMWALLHSGAFADLRRAHDEYVRDARRRGDLFVETTILRGCNIVTVAAGRIADAHRDLEQASWSPPQHGGFHLQHWFELKAYGELALYEGNAADRLDDLQRDLNTLARSQLTRIQFVRCESRWLAARLALAAAETGGSSGSSDKAAKAAKRVVAQLQRERIVYADVWAGLLGAGVAAFEQDDERAVTLLREAMTEADERGMRFYAAAARRRLGALLGGDEGAELIAQADEAMSKEGVVAPERFVQLPAPGFTRGR